MRGVAVEEREVGHRMPGAVPGGGLLESETFVGFHIKIGVVSSLQEAPSTPAWVDPRVSRWPDGALVFPRVAVALQWHAGCPGAGCAAGTCCRAMSGSCWDLWAEGVLGCTGSLVLLSSVFVVDISQAAAVNLLRPMYTKVHSLERSPQARDYEIRLCNDEKVDRSARII